MHLNEASKIYGLLRCRLPSGNLLFALALVIGGLSACKKETVGIRIFYFPEDTDTSGEDWIVAARVQEISRNQGGFAVDGPRTIKISFEYPDRSGTSDFEMAFSNDLQLSIEGGWLSSESFRLEIGGIEKLGASDHSSFSASYIFHPHLPKD